MKSFLGAALSAVIAVSCLRAQSAPAASPASAPAKPAAPQQRLNSSAQRNENVAIWFIDTNAVKEANVRVGTVATAVAEPAAEAQYFAAEHGRPASELLLLRPAARPTSWHGEGFWWHQNSIFNARTFFQVGGVKPSHRNFQGGRLSGLLPRLGALTATLSQHDIRGMVNGNVLVPLASERTPLATDPATRALVQRYLNAYPTELPNRPDFDQRALNTNAPQRIDSLAGTLRLDANTGAKGKLMMSYGIDRQRILAFQLVAGQNPNTEIHSHRAKLTWQRTLSPSTQLQLGAAFARNLSSLVSEPNAVGPRVRFGYSIEELGPDSSFPIHRATNTFRYGAQVQHQAAGGRHAVSGGADVTRFQLNGVESNNQRGQFQFASNFGRNSIDNLRWGTPNMFEGAIGELSRGYRNWTTNAYLADKWKVSSRVQLYLGLRYTADTRPVEVHERETLPYRTDANNLSPRVSLAWQAGQGWVVRAMYTTTFGQILPVTYQQVRNNRPLVTYVMVPDPNLVNPTQGLNLSTARYSPTFLSPDLVTPYSHQYNAGFEHKLLAGSVLRLNYIGSRTFKLLNSYTLNRAEPLPGMAWTTANVDQRRADARYSDVKSIVNGGIAYFDGAQAVWDLPLRRGLLASVTYTFSKAIDEGPDFTSTAANKDIANVRTQWQYQSFKDRKGLSNFDSTHALMLSYAWELPVARGAGRWLKAATTGWLVSGANMWKKGTPLTLFVGSDAPGFGNIDGGGADRPNLVDPTILGVTIGHPDTAAQILRRDRFAFIAPGQRAGNLGRGTFRKASIWNWNTAVARQFRLPNDWSMLLRAEAYNLSNTPQFDEPQRNLSSPAFGKITNTLNDGRVMQVGLRLVF